MRHFAIALTISTVPACTLERSGVGDPWSAPTADLDDALDERKPPRSDDGSPDHQPDAEPSREDAADETKDASAPRAPDGEPATRPGPKDDSDRYDWMAGDYPPGLDEQTYLTLDTVTGPSGQPREYKVHVPTGYDRKKATPIVYAFHGIGQNAVSFAVQGTDLVDKSEREGFILVLPNGVQEGGGSWNGGLCCGAAASQRVDDVMFVRALHAELSRHLHVDARRVYATGFSNGGFLAYRLACDAADLFTAVAPVAAALGTTDASSFVLAGGGAVLASCKPSQPVALLALHGSADPLVPVRAMELSVQHLAQESGCKPSESSTKQPTSGGDTTCVSHSGCRDKVEVSACSVATGGHCWFGSPTCGAGSLGGAAFAGRNSNFLNATDALWSFFERSVR